MGHALGYCPASGAILILAICLSYLVVLPFKTDEKMGCSVWGFGVQCAWLDGLRLRVWSVS